MAEFFTIVVKDGQNIFDLSTQEYGTIDGVFALMEDNPEIIKNLDSRLFPGQVLKIREVFNEISDTELEQQRLFRTKNIKVNTGDLVQIGGFSDGFSDGFFN